jgi:alkyl hydroperoxide reductase subunit AhpC
MAPATVWKRSSEVAGGPGGIKGPDLGERGASGEDHIGLTRPILLTLQEFAPMRKLFLSLAGLALIASPVLAGEYNKVITVGQKAPSFSGIPAVIGEKEATLDLNNLAKNDVVVLVFLANHCPVVTAYEDRVIDFANDYKDKGVKVVGVCVDVVNEQDKLPGIKQRVKEKGYPFVYGYDDSQQIGRAYGATNTPQFVVIDKDQTIRYTGAMDDSQNENRVSKQYLRDAVDSVLKNETVEVKETRAVGCGIRYRR